MSKSFDSGKHSRTRIWSVVVLFLTVVGFWLGVINDGVGIWSMFKPKDQIEAEILENGLKEYLEEQK